MAYTVLARRYRSATFDQVIGQGQVAQTLKKAIVSGRVAHAFLFCGTRGVGKTSVARILAKALNCESTAGPSPEPCLKCKSCQAIARGEDMDVIEIDAASNTGVDSVREIIDNAQYKPAHSRFKIYIIDEVHMLSKSAFNALLKTLEEPPEHVKFILATTEPEKVLPTILSRCQRYDFRNIPTREIAAHLKDICGQEKIEADDDALMLVAKAGSGSMRDSLSLLDRLLSIGEMRITCETIERLLGLPRAQLIFDLVQAIGEGRVKDVLGQADKMIQDGLSSDTLLATLVDQLRNLMILRTCGADSGLVEVPNMSMDDLVAQANQFEIVSLTADIAILEELRRQLRQSQAGRALLDAALVRLALARQFTSVERLLAQADGIVGSPVEKKKSESVTTGPVASVIPAPVAASVAAPPTTIAPPPQPAAPPPTIAAPPAAGATAVTPAQGQAGANGPLPTNADIPRIWPQVLAKATRLIATCLGQGRLARFDAHVAVIAFPPDQETFIKMLGNNGNRDAVQQVFTEVCGTNVGVEFEVEEAAAQQPTATPATTAASGAASPAAASNHAMPAPAESMAMPMRMPVVDGRPSPEQVATLNNDPLGRAVMEQLEAIVVKISEPST